jgi:hypothetical protein
MLRDEPGITFGGARDPDWTVYPRESASVHEVCVMQSEESAGPALGSLTSGES